MKVNLKKVYLTEKEYIMISSQEISMKVNGQKEKNIKMESFLLKMEGNLDNSGIMGKKLMMIEFEI